MLTWRGLRKMLTDGQDKGSSDPVSSRSSTGVVTVVGDFQIDRKSRTASLRGHGLQLTSSEFDLLVFLVEHPQRLVTPQTILATSSNKECPSRTDFLPTLLSLRAKLDAAGA